MIQNPNSLSEDNLEDDPDVIDPENDSTTDSSSEDGDYGTDNNDNERINNEDTYHRVLEYAMYMKSLAQDLHAKCDAPIMKVNITQFIGQSLL